MSEFYRQSISSIYWYLKRNTFYKSENSKIIYPLMKSIKLFFYYYYCCLNRYTYIWALEIMLWREKREEEEKKEYDRVRKRKRSLNLFFSCHCGFDERKRNIYISTLWISQPRHLITWQVAGMPCVCGVLDLFCIYLYRNFYKKWPSYKKWR